MKKKANPIDLSREKIGRSAKILALLICMMMLNFNSWSSVVMQGTQIIINEENISLEDLVWKIKEESGYKFIYNTKHLAKYDNMTVNEKGNVNEVLDAVLENTDLTYSIKNEAYVIKPRSEKPKTSTSIQQEQKTITGKVLDEKGQPLPGATVLVQGKMVGVVTDMKGKFSIKVDSKDALTFSFVGYKTQIVLVEGKEKIDVNLVPDAENLEEVSVVAFGSQKKESVVSSITSVKSDALRNSTSDLTSALAGNVAGITAWQTGGMPGAMTEEEMNTKFYIRGITSFQTDANIDPLILMDGVEVSKVDLSRVDPDDIESFNVLKDASATAMYGARGANGVIYVKTKKGKSGNVYTTVRYERIYSKPTREIDVVDPVSYMEMYNEALIGRYPGSAPKYTREKIDRTASGEYPKHIYPATDWYKMLFKDYTVNNHYALNVRGGTDKIQYYASLTYNDDEGYDQN